MLNLVLLALMLIGLLVMFVTVIRSRAANREKSKSKEGALPSDAGVRDLINEGQKQAAIDLYRRFTGVDEFTARNAIAEIERELRLSDNQTEQFRQILENKGKAVAIEAYQEATGANLADALEFIESL
jgi:ribosomal protein L7/L12